MRPLVAGELRLAVGDDVFLGQTRVFLHDHEADRFARSFVGNTDHRALGDAYSTPLLYYKGFHALQAYRVTHWLWGQGRKTLALFLQNRISEVMGVDIHPAARIGCGVMLDHATGFVVGETAVIGDNVSILQGVTLGGTGKECGDRHPKIGNGVLIGANATVLGNITVGEGAKIGAGSVVLAPVPAHATVAGVPAKVVGNTGHDAPALSMDQHFDGDEGCTVCPVRGPQHG